MFIPRFSVQYRTHFSFNCMTNMYLLFANGFGLARENSTHSKQPTCGSSLFSKKIIFIFMNIYTLSLILAIVLVPRIFFFAGCISLCRYCIFSQQQWDVLEMFTGLLCCCIIVFLIVIVFIFIFIFIYAHSRFIFFFVLCDFCWLIFQNVLAF